MPQSNIKVLFADICYNAYCDGAMILSGGSIRRDRDHPSMQPGYYYNNLPDHIKEQIKAELTSDIAKGVAVRVLLESPLVEPWWDKTLGSRFFKTEKLKFEQELIKHGWKPNFSL